MYIKHWLRQDSSQSHSFKDGSGTGGIFYQMKIKGSTDEKM